MSPVGTRGLIWALGKEKKILSRWSMRAVLNFADLSVSLPSGCSNPQPLAEKVGQNCTVQFRRGDALGAGGDLTVSPTTNGINVATVSVSGRLRAASVDWIAVESGNRGSASPASPSCSCSSTSRAAGQPVVARMMLLPG